MQPPTPELGGTTAWYEAAAGRIAYELIGAGSTVLLLHAPEIGGGRQEWCELAPRLVTAGYRVVAPDLPGFGASPAPEGRLTAETQISALGEFVARVVKASCHALARGHAAAYLAVLAAADPARFPSLTLVTPHGMHPNRASERIYRRLTQPLVGRFRFAYLASRWSVARWLAEDAWFDPARVTPEELARCRRWARRPGSQAVLASLVAGDLARDVRRDWAAVEQPTLLVWGMACDDPPFDEIPSWLAPLRPDAPVMMIERRPMGIWKDAIRQKTCPETRQRPHREAPEAVAEAILEHLHSVDRRLAQSAAKPREDELS